MAVQAHIMRRAPHSARCVGRGTPGVVPAHLYEYMIIHGFELMNTIRSKQKHVP